MEFLAKTIIGLEDICAAELKGKKVAPGRVLFKKEKKDCKSAESIIQLMKFFSFKTFEDIEENLADLPITNNKILRVKCNRSGSHLFKSVDVEKVVCFSLHKKDVVVDFKDFESVLIIDIIDNFCFVGFLLQEKLCRREYRVKLHNQGVNGCVAFSLLQLAKLKKSDSLLDPLCKDGAIPIEAALLGNKNVFAFDPAKNNIRNADVNRKLAKVDFDFTSRELSWLETMFGNQGVDKIVTAIVVSSKDKHGLERARKLFYQAKSIVKEKFVFLSNKEDLDTILPAEFILKEKRTIQRGGMTEYIYVCDVK